MTNRNSLIVAVGTLGSFLSRRVVVLDESVSDANEISAF